MRDPLTLDGAHPEHRCVVATVARAFELVLDETPARRAGGGESDLVPGIVGACDGPRPSTGSG